MTIAVLRARDRIATPWKNGGGVTCQIAVEPAGADVAVFDWRVSTATVAAAGPFSAFPGVDRLMLVLEGRLELEIAGADPLTLDATCPAVHFPGDAPVRALAPATPVSDINVMVRRGRFSASMERRRIAGAAAVVCQDVTLILASVGGVDAALGAQTLELGPGDAARIDDARGALARLHSAGPADLIVIHVNTVR